MRIIITTAGGIPCTGPDIPSQALGLIDHIYLLHGISVIGGLPWRIRRDLFKGVYFIARQVRAAC